ncbi:uncharacterized protein LOC129962854 [Argiope bruennichi]|uniref:uncharacterized protein LOC129962854 n=1 Tax=Argiope bruennichi TaxID=94029 RepID=UPI0024945A8C|nr:uncharacterized protein LOC129962854 [Argiope bruennichi]
MRFLLGDQSTKTKIFCNEQDNYPLAVAAGKDFYVDDILSGTEDLSSAIELQEQLIYLLKSAGLLGPLIITAKIFLQKLWVLRIDWDDEVPLHLNREWEKFSTELSQLKNLNVDRHVLCSEALKVDLIGFGDASKNAYSCDQGFVKSTPGLCQGLLNVEVLSFLQLDIHGVYLYSDSTVVLAWIKTPLTLLKTFVANRVTRIQEYTKNFQWHYANTAENPEDLISRGAFPSKIQQLDIWWNGPSFLSSSSWPNFSDDPGVSDVEYLLEVKGTAKNTELNKDSMINLSICNNPSFLECLLEISNNYCKIVRVLSYVFRFVKNLKGAVKTTGPLNAEELNYAETFFIKNVQIQKFAKDVNSLQKHHCVPPGSKLKTFNPFLDSKGLLRVGGRLEDKKKPSPSNVEDVATVLVEASSQSPQNSVSLSVVYCVLDMPFTIVRKIVR